MTLFCNPNPLDHPLHQYIECWLIETNFMPFYRILETQIIRFSKIWIVDCVRRRWDLYGGRRAKKKSFFLVLVHRSTTVWITIPTAPPQRVMVRVRVTARVRVTDRVRVRVTARVRVRARGVPDSDFRLGRSRIPDSSNYPGRSRSRIVVFPFSNIFWFEITVLLRCL